MSTKTGRSQNRVPQGNGLGRLQFGGFPLQGGFQEAPFLGGNPLRFPRMIPDAEPPDGQPKERQQPFQDQHLLPAIGAQQPAGKRGGRRDGQRLAKIPISVGPGAFASREPIGQQHHRRRKHAAFGNAQQKAHHLELPEGARQAAADRADAPGDQEQADDLARAPARRPIAARDLEQDVAEEENAGGLAFHPVVHQQVLHHGRDGGVQRQGDVRPVHVRDGVHDQRDGNDAQPALVCHKFGRCVHCISAVARLVTNKVRGQASRRPRWPLARSRNSSKIVA